MADSATVLIAAFGGGLAGAVLPPVVDYGMHRLRRNGELRKERERHLRKMIESQVDYQRRTLEFAGVRLAASEEGTPTNLAEMSQPLNEWQGPAWQPNRVEAPTLKRLSTEASVSSLSCWRLWSSNGSLLGRHLAWPGID